MSDDAARRARLAEAVAGEYELLEELGRGGMATVHRARELALGREVAIKVMAPELLAVEGMAERFVNEARIAAALSHPHIIPIHAVRRHGDVLYFVMKYVAGRPLDAILRDAGPLPVDVVRAVLTQVGAALDAAHRRGVVHRDVKPANILIDEHGDAVVADFGIARVSEQPGRTQAGQTVGTPQYMSPEQCAGTPLSGAADQYALGVVAYELLTGRPPITGEGLVQVVWNMMHQRMVPVAERRADCPEALALAVHRMLAHDAADRFPSVADAIAALPALALAPDAPARRALVGLARAAHRSSAGEASAGAGAAATVVSGAAAPGLTAPGAGATAASASAAIRIALSAAVMTIDDEAALHPDVRDASGAALSPLALSWETLDPEVARVDADGRVRALRIGQARIVARAGTAMATLQLTVTRAGVRTLAIGMPPGALEVGDRVALKLVTGEAPGALPHPRLADWRTSDPRVATVDAAGRVTAHAEGGVEVTARTGGATAVASLRVTKAFISAVEVVAPAPRLSTGMRVQLDARPANTKGHPLEGLPVRWEVSDPGIAVVSPEGVLTAKRSGQVLVAARVGGRVGTARLTVVAG